MRTFKTFSWHRENYERAYRTLRIINKPSGNLTRDVYVSTESAGVVIAAWRFAGQMAIRSFNARQDEPRSSRYHYRLRHCIRQRSIDECIRECKTLIECPVIESEGA
jgi:hypothetical protein